MKQAEAGGSKGVGESDTSEMFRGDILALERHNLTTYIIFVAMIFLGRFRTPTITRKGIKARHAVF